MSVPPPSHDLDDVAPIPVMQGPGEQLRAAREAAGMSVHEISARMRLTSGTILALEADDYAQLPAPIFVRGYLRGYARLLELPPEPIVQAYEQRNFEPPSLVADISLGSQMQSGDFPFRIVTWIVVAALIVLVVLWWRSQDSAPVRSETTPPAEVAEAGRASTPDEAPVTETQESPSSGATTASETQEATPPDTAPPPEEVPATEAQAAPSSDATTATEAQGAAPPDEEPASATRDESGGGGREAPESGSVSAPEPEPASVTPETEPVAIGVDATTVAAEADTASPASTPAGEPAAPEEAESATPEAPAEQEPEAGIGVDGAPEPEAEAQDTALAAPAEATEDRSALAVETGEGARPGTDASTDRLELGFTSECWLEVYDSADERLFYGLAQPGDRLDLRGQGPMRLVFGNAESVEVRYNGAIVDFSAFSTDGVARFSLGGEPPTAFRTPTASQSARELESPGT